MKAGTATLMVSIGLSKISSLMWPVQFRIFQPKEWRIMIRQTITTVEFFFFSTSLFITFGDFCHANSRCGQEHISCLSSCSSHRQREGSILNNEQNQGNVLHIQAADSRLIEKFIICVIGNSRVLHYLV